MTRRYPTEICDRCEADAPEHWLTDRLMYCQHHRVIVWRGDPAAAWSFHRNAKPAHFKKALDVAQATFRAHCAKTGVTQEQGDQMMTIVRQMEKNRV